MIESAILKGSNLSVYGKNGKLLYTYTITNAVLLGFTTTTVSIKQGNSIKVLDETGRTISNRTVG